MLIGVSRAAMERSLTRTRKLCQPCQGCLDCQYHLAAWRLEDPHPLAQLARSLDVQRVWLCGALWASLTLGGRHRSCSFDPKRNVGIGRGRSYRYQMHFPGAGNNVLSYAYMRHTSFVSCFVHHAARSRPSVPPRVDLKVSRRSSLPSGLAVLRNRSRLVGECSFETCSRAEWPSVAQEQCGKWTG